MSLAFHPDEPNPFVRALLADRGLASGEVDLAIDARDEMLGYWIGLLDGNRDRALFTYFRSGLSIADSIGQVLRWRFRESPRVLDFASGYGRVTRFLLREIPASRLWVSDIYEDAVRFQRERFGVHGFPSALRPEDLRCDETFDAVLVTSLFTHLPEERFHAWLRALLGRVRPGGLLVFTTHDPSLLRDVEGSPEMPAGGLLFQEHSESGSLDTRDYGSTWVTEEFVRRALAGAGSVHRVHRGLCDYQDLWLVAPEPGVDFSGLRFHGEPRLSLERCEIRDGWLELSGWAAVRCGGAREVQVMLDERCLGSFPLAEPRPDVAERMGEPCRQAGWAGSCALPEGSYRAASVLRVRVVDERGAAHPMFAGPVEAALLESARNEEVSRGRERLEERDRFYKQEAWLWNQKKELEARLAAVEASRFWKIRGAWFALKRTLGLTRDP